MLRGQVIARVACVVVLLLHLIAGIAAVLLLPHVGPRRRHVSQSPARGADSLSDPPVGEVAPPAI